VPTPKCDLAWLLEPSPRLPPENRQEAVARQIHVTMRENE
jgi:hypothetical protein